MKFPFLILLLCVQANAAVYYGGAWASGGDAGYAVSSTTTNLATANVATSVIGSGGATATITAGALSVTAVAGIFCGSTGNFAVPAATTCYYQPFNSQTNLNTSDVSGGTRIVCPRAITLTNLYVVASSLTGSGKTTTITIFTNGVSTGLVASLTNASSGNDTTHTTLVNAGVEIGVQVVVVASGAVVKYNWGFECR